LDIVLSGLALITAAAALFVAWWAWKSPRAPDPRDIHTFSGSLDEKRRSFLRFLDDNKSRKVLIDAWSDGSKVDGLASQGDWLADTEFSLKNVEERLESRIVIAVRKLSDSPLTYAHGTWRLQGYFAVQGLVDVWQGVSVRILVPISLKEAVI
jgi:hypothetical protein